MRLLDLFCGAGGAAMGYSRAGFDEIVGVDIEPQPDYPFQFIQDDISEWSYIRGAQSYDLIHASPPCQAYTTMNNRHGSTSPRLIEWTAALLTQWAKKYVLENVRGARSVLRDPIELTGEMFGLPVHRPRLFELGKWTALVPFKPHRQLQPVAVYGKPDGRRLWDRKDGSMLRAWTFDEGRDAMGMPWVTEERGIREAIPPAYTEYLGRQFLDQMARAS